MHIWSAGNRAFANLLDQDEEDGKPFYLWGLLGGGDREMIVWLPEVKSLKALVEEGKLPGEVDEDGSVILHQLNAEQLALLTSDSEGVLFDWDEPLVLFKFSE